MTIHGREPADSDAPWKLDGNDDSKLKCTTSGVNLAILSDVNFIFSNERIPDVWKSYIKINKIRVLKDLPKCKYLPISKIFLLF